MLYCTYGSLLNTILHRVSLLFGITTLYSSVALSCPLVQCSALTVSYFRLGGTTHIYWRRTLFGSLKKRWREVRKVVNYVSFFLSVVLIRAFSVFHYLSDFFIWYSITILQGRNLNDFQHCLQMRPARNALNMVLAVFFRVTALRRFEILLAPPELMAGVVSCVCDFYIWLLRSK